MGPKGYSNEWRKSGKSARRALGILVRHPTTTRPSRLGWRQIHRAAGGGVLDEAAAQPLMSVHATPLTRRRSPHPQVAQSALACGAAPTPSPVLALPAARSQCAQANHGPPHPWGGDYAHTVSSRVGAVNRGEGVTGATRTCRRRECADPTRTTGHCVYLRVDPQSAGVGVGAMGISIVAKRVAPGRDPGRALTYAATTGDRDTGGYCTIPRDDPWHEQGLARARQLRRPMASDCRGDAIGSSHACLRREVGVGKLGPASARSPRHRAPGPAPHEEAHRLRCPHPGHPATDTGCPHSAER